MQKRYPPDPVRAEEHWQERRREYLPWRAASSSWRLKNASGANRPRVSVRNYSRILSMEEEVMSEHPEPAHARFLSKPFWLNRFASVSPP
jgi:hypothetical protein